MRAEEEGWVGGGGGGGGMEVVEAGTACISDCELRAFDRRRSR